MAVTTASSTINGTDMDEILSFIAEEAKRHRERAEKRGIPEVFCIIEARSRQEAAAEYEPNTKQNTAEKSIFADGTKQI